VSTTPPCAPVAESPRAPRREAVLCELARHSALPHDLRALADQLDYLDYLAVARVLDRDQAFWLPLLPVGDGSGVALVFETRLGSLTTRLAPHYAEVIAWHRSAAAAAITEKRLTRLGLGNVRLVVGAQVEDVLRDSKRLSALVAIGLSEDLIDMSDGKLALVDAILKQTPRWLAPDGVIVIADNNRMSFRRLLSAQARTAGSVGLSLARIGRALRSCRRRVDLYVCRGPLTAELAPPPDLVGVGALRAGTSLHKSWNLRWKERVLNSGPGRLLWPSFLAVGSSGTTRSLLHDILAESDVARRLGWGSRLPALKRVVAGHRDTAIFVAGPSTRDDADVIARLPLTAAALGPWRTNGGALRLLATSPLAGLVPRLVADGVFREQHFTIETRCTGLEVEYDAPGVDRLARGTCDTLEALHHAARREEDMTAAAFDSSLAPSIRELAEWCTPAARTRLEAIEGALAEAMAGVRVVRGHEHGDFKLGNILFDRSGRVSAIIDWDGFSADGFPCFDYLTLLTYKIASNRRIGLAEAYLEHLLPWNLPARDAAIADGPLSRLVIDARSFLPLRAVFWFVLASRRFERYYKQHRYWQQRVLEPVLSALEEAGRSGWRRPEAGLGP
jgi:SAM-dependent methyltransferase